MSDVETDFNDALISQITEKEDKLVQLNTDIDDKSKELASIKAEMLARKKLLEDYKNEQKIYTKNERIISLEDELTAKNTLIIALNEKINKLEENKKLLMLPADPTESVNENALKLKKVTQAILYKERKFQSILQANRAHINELKASVDEANEELTKANNSIIELEKMLSIKSEEAKIAIQEKDQTNFEMASATNKMQQLQAQVEESKMKVMEYDQIKSVLDETSKEASEEKEANKKLRDELAELKESLLKTNAKCELLSKYRMQFKDLSQNLKVFLQSTQIIINEKVTRLNTAIADKIRAIYSNKSEHEFDLKFNVPMTHINEVLEEYTKINTQKQIENSTNKGITSDSSNQPQNISNKEDDKEEKGDKIEKKTEKSKTDVNDIEKAINEDPTLKNNPTNEDEVHNNEVINKTNEKQNNGEIKEDHAANVLKEKEKLDELMCIEFCESEKDDLINSLRKVIDMFTEFQNKLLSSVQFSPNPKQEDFDAYKQLNDAEKLNSNLQEKINKYETTISSQQEKIRVLATTLSEASQKFEKYKMQSKLENEERRQIYDSNISTSKKKEAQILKLQAELKSSLSLIQELKSYNSQ